jgi:hypothetical protein
MQDTAKGVRERLDALSVGFRSRYVTYEELTRQVRAWAEAFPEIVRLESIGATPEGRSLWLLKIGARPDGDGPVAWVDGNMHAVEVAGCSVALAIAEDAIGNLVDPGAPLHDLPAHLAALLREDVTIYVLPRICPDGADHVLGTSGYVRSNPRDERIGRGEPYWCTADMDGDGRALSIRREDPAGDFVASSEVPGLMLPRGVEDPGPYYAVYPEGTIERWDGFTIPAPSYLSDNAVDMNRNFPYAWAPEPEQKGAGPYATSEPESRAIVEFTSRRPNIFAWINFHTFGGVFIRPAGDKTDKRMDQSDLSLYLKLEGWAERCTGYPMVSGYEEFTYEPDKPLSGDLCAYAYAQRGTVAMVCELWDLWKQVGLPVLRPFVFNYQRRKHEDLVQVARWDREHNEGRVVGAWRPVEHPQLGKVEIGGPDPRFGIWNPPPERLAEICEQQARFFFRLAALAPRLRISSPEVKRLGEELWEVSATVENLGYLPTFVLSSSRALPWNDAVRARVAPEAGVALAVGEAEIEVGHLDGWGASELLSAPALPRSAGGLRRKRVRWVVRGRGPLTIRAGCPRTGHVETRVEVG